MSLFKKLIEGLFVLFLISCSAQEEESFSISTELHDVMSEVRNENVPVSVILPPNFVKGAKEIPLLINLHGGGGNSCLLYTSPSPRDRTRSRMPSSA